MMLRFKPSNARKTAARSTSEISNFLAWLLLIIGIGDPTLHLLTGLVHLRWCRILSINSIPCPKGAASLVPGATEHQQKASRPWSLGKLVCLVLKFWFLNLTNFFYCNVNSMILYYIYDIPTPDF